MLWCTVIGLICVGSSPIPILDINWRSILVPPNHDVVTCSKQSYTSKHSTVPIHRLCIHRLRGREEAKDEKTDEECK